MNTGCACRIKSAGWSTQAQCRLEWSIWSSPFEPLSFLINRSVHVSLHQLIVLRLRHRHVLLSLARRCGPHELLETRRGKDDYRADGIGPMLDAEIHVPAGMNTVDPACTSLTRCYVHARQPKSDKNLRASISSAKASLLPTFRRSHERNANEEEDCFSIRPHLRR